jgi:MFS transporter, OPA family, glycerol-3-phosphate transporter
MSRWQKIILAALFVGYAGYYVCRINLAVATPLMLEQETAGDLTKEQVGLIVSLGVAAYAIGKILSGTLADFFGGRALFLAGMFGSIACTLVFGLHSGLLFFAALWIANRFFQSMGWVALIKIVSRWFPVTRHAAIMGWLSTSFLVGDAFGKWYLGTFIRAGESAPLGSPWAALSDWRSVFFISAITLAVVTLVVARLLKSSPTEVGEKEPAANPANVFGEKGNDVRPENLVSLLRPLVSSYMFWIICLLNVGLTLIRETFNFWTPTIFQSEVGLSPGRAAQYSSLFPLIGGVSVVLAGVFSTRLGGRHGRILAPSITLLAIAIASFAVVDLQGRPALAATLLGFIAFFLLAPYSYLAGVMALDLGGKRGSSSASGLIDSAGYLGAIFSGFAVGSLATQRGWSFTAGCLAAVAAITAVLGFLYWILHERTLRRVTQPRIGDNQPPGNSSDNDSN